MIRGLWDWQADVIIVIKLGDADTDFYKYQPMAALLDWWETIKKDKHGKHCHDQGKRLLSFFSFCQRHAREGIPGHTHAIE